MSYETLNFKRMPYSSPVRQGRRFLTNSEEAGPSSGVTSTAKIRNGSFVKTSDNRVSSSKKLFDSSSPFTFIPNNISVASKRKRRPLSSFVSAAKFGHHLADSLGKVNYASLVRRRNKSSSTASLSPDSLQSSNHPRSNTSIEQIRSEAEDASNVTCPPDKCPACRIKYSKDGVNRCLVDSCGHLRCYTCMFQCSECPLCVGKCSIEYGSSVANRTGSTPPKQQKPDLREKFSAAIHVNRIRPFKDVTSFKNRRSSSRFFKQSSSRYTTDTTDSAFGSDDNTNVSEDLILNAITTSSYILSGSNSVDQNNSVSRESGFHSIPSLNGSSDSTKSLLASSSSTLKTEDCISLLLKPLFFHDVPFKASCMNKNDLNEDQFFGRRWIFSEIQDNLSSSLLTNRGTLVIGGPGTGKTALIRHLLEHSVFSMQNNDNVNDIFQTLSSQVLAYHFCQWDDYRTCNVPEFVHSLAAIISQSPHMSSYHNALQSSVSSNDSNNTITRPNLVEALSIENCIKDPDSAFLTGVVHPLQELYASDSLSDSVRIILIDGLEQSELFKSSEDDSIGSFLLRHIHSLPPFLKFVVTVQSAVGEEIVSRIPFQRVHLDKSDVDDRVAKDLTDLISHRVRASDTIRNNVTPISVVSSSNNKIPSESDREVNHVQRFTEYLVKMCEGSFLFVSKILNLLHGGQLVIKSSSFNVLPQNISQLFQLEFNLKFPSTKSYEKVRHILEVMLASRVPLTLDEIRETVVNCEHDGSMTRNEFSMRFASLSDFIYQQSNGTYSLKHPSLRMWLSCSSNSTKFLCDSRVGNSSIAIRIGSDIRQMICSINRSGAGIEVESELSEKILQFAHHVLKAHSNRSINHSIPLKLMQDTWMKLDNLQCFGKGLCSPRNISTPNLKVSRFLLLGGGDVNERTWYEQRPSPVHVHAARGNVEVVALLIEFGADVNMPNDRSETPLMAACKSGHIKTVRVLVRHGAKLSTCDVDGMSPCTLAASHGHIEIVEFITDKALWDVTFVDENSGEDNADNNVSHGEACNQAFVQSIKNGHLNIFNHFLEHNLVDIEKVDTYLTNETPLSCAISNVREDFVEKLLQSGVKTSIPDSDKQYPIHLAVRTGNFCLVKTLFRHQKIPVDQIDGEGHSPLCLAVIEGHLPIVSFLAEKGCNVNGRDKKTGISILGHACQQGHENIVKLLLKSNKIQTGSDVRLYCLAAPTGSVRITQALIDAGCQGIDEPDLLSGYRPLDLAISGNHRDLLTLLLKRGVKLSPQTWEVASSNTPIVLTLLNKLLEDGNTLYRRGEFQEACERYSYALRRISSHMNCANKSDSNETIQEKPSPNLDEVFEKLKMHLLLNLCRCYRKLSKFELAIDCASAVLNARRQKDSGDQQSTVDALIARGKALHESGDIKEALQNYEMAETFTPNNAEIKELLEKVRNEIK